MFRCALLTAFAAALVRLQCAEAQVLDVYRTHESVSNTSMTAFVTDGSCRPLEPDRPIELEDAILQAICANPVARRALANTYAQMADIGVNTAAYLPTLNATAGIARNSTSTTYGTPGFDLFTQNQTNTDRYGVFSLSWVLFDFGLRSANLRQARALLAAANAAQDDTVQSVFFNAARAFYGLRDAQASANAARAAEQSARESLIEATARHEAGAGTLSDQLQTQTTYRRALLDRVSADGDSLAAMGSLAVAMGMSANTPVRITVSESPPDSAVFSREIDQLIDEAQKQHPTLRAARAKLEAARAHIDAVRAAGLPSVALTGSVSRNNASWQQRTGKSSSHGNTIGVQITIPLFEGFASGYRTAEAKAQADAQSAELQGAELQVSLDVWKSYQSLQTDTTNLDNSKYLLEDAQRSLEIARGRYKAGVGTITELLSAQTALADAQRQRVLALSKWRTARLRLATSLGNLNLQTIR
jgi:outer membrane protein